MIPAIRSGSPACGGGVDRGDRALVGVDAAEVREVAAGLGVQLEAVGVDAVVDGGGVVEGGVPVGVADGDVGGSAVVLGVHGDDAW